MIDTRAAAEELFDETAEELDDRTSFSVTCDARGRPQCVLPPTIVLNGPNKTDMEVAFKQLAYAREQSEKMNDVVEQFDKVMSQVVSVEIHRHHHHAHTHARPHSPTQPRTHHCAR